jgi:hypothetical protein
MVPYLDCEHAREMLQAFVDRELPVEEQVAVETHLRWCDTCAAHVEDLVVIGNSIRIGAAATPSQDDQLELAGLQASVLSRVRVEREQSLGMRFRSLLDDRHLLWAGLGATTALLVCFFGMMSVLHAASDERPDSLAGVIQSLANPGSDSNPMLLDGRMIQVPRALDYSPALDQLNEDEAVFALATVVTREGRIANYEVLSSERDGARRNDRPDRERRVNSLLDRVTRSRFAPAEQGVARAPVAVNMVWLLARTTVKGSSPRALEAGPRLEPEPEPVSAPIVPAAKPGTDGLNEQAIGNSAFRGCTAIV